MAIVGYLGILLGGYEPFGDDLGWFVELRLLDLEQNGRIATCEDILGAKRSLGCSRNVDAVE